MMLLGEVEERGPAAAPAAAARRVAFLLSHSSAGGAQEIWANLAEAFRSDGYDVSLCALYPGRREVRETAAGLPWRYVVPRRPASPLAVAGLVRRLVGFLREERFEVVFCAMPAANVLASVAARLAGVGTRVVISHHSPVETHNPVLNAVDSVAGCLGSVQAVVSVSESVGRSLDRKPGPYRSKRRTITNALPPRIEDRLAALAAGRAGRVRSRRVVATGRLAAQKNYPALIRAAVHMPDVEVVIVGSGPDEARLKRLAADLGVDGRVAFLGQRSREEALDVLATADVFAQPSLFEGHSLALIEAAKLGLPLVVSDVPVQVEGITAPDGSACGIAVDPHDDRALAAAIRGLLADPAAYGTWAAGATRLASTATFDRMVASYQRLVTP